MPLLAMTNQTSCSKCFAIPFHRFSISDRRLQAFLSKEMMYSCALWDDAEGGVRGDLEVGPNPGDLEAAQRRKIHHVLRKARVQPGHRILEFGSGWGGLAIEVNLLHAVITIRYIDTVSSLRLRVLLAAKSIP
jgi:cyclopropane fatty-acyl-phospholipid synthase-like methyltransferase